MLDTKAFKQAVLNQAMQGKLTQQLPEDGNAIDLLQSIDDERKRLIDEGKIKKQKPLPDIDSDEIPFEIPENWQWVRLGNVSLISTGFSFKKSSYTDEGTMIVRISDFNEDGLIKKRPAFVKFDSKFSKFLLNPGDILMAMTGGTVGKVSPVIFPKNKILLNQRVARFNSIYLENYFLNYYLRSNYVQNKIQFNKNSTNDNISMTFLNSLVFPLPPLAEQQRIVSQIDKCFKLSNSIDDEHELNRNFSTNMHTSLLNAAIQGKLTRQLPEDGSASDLLNSIKDEKQRLINEGKIKKQKPLPDIDPDEIPFKIPNNWQWVRIPEVSTFPEQKTVKPSDISGDTWVLDLKDIEKSTGKINHKNYNKYSKVKSNKVIFNKGDVLYNKLRPYLNKVIVAPDSGVATSELFVIPPFDGIDANYLSLVLRSPFFLNKINSDTYGTKMPRAGTKNFIKYLIPLPPFLEQQRIVSKLNSLFSKLNRI